MLYSLIIIEDDDHIRDGLVQLIDWQSMGFFVLQEFSCGEDALTFLKEKQPDVILTDICMKDISGIDVAFFARQKKPNTEIILISAYRDFNYAHDAINLSVAGYLLKPLKLDELYRVFQIVKERLDESAFSVGTLSSVQSQCLRDQLLHELIFSKQNLTDEQFREKQKSLGISVKTIPGFLCMLKFGKSSGNTKKNAIAYNAFRQHILHLFALKECSIYEINGHNSHDDIIFLLIHAEESAILLNVHRFCRLRLSESIQLALGMDVCICTGNIISSVGEFHSDFVNLQQKMGALFHLQLQSSESKYDSTQEWVDEARQYIKQHFTEALTLENVSSHVYITPSYFSRVFKKITGNSFIEYLTRIRIEAACDLLSHPNTVIWQVGQSVGYNSPKHFSRIFRSITGKTPSEYQKECMDQRTINCTQ